MTGAPQQSALVAFAKGRPFSFWASSLENQQSVARAGAGIAALPDFMAGNDEDLVPVLQGEPLLSRTIWLVVHSDLKQTSRVKVVSERLRQIFSHGATGQRSDVHSGETWTPAAIKEGGRGAPVPDA